MVTDIPYTSLSEAAPEPKTFLVWFCYTGRKQGCQGHPNKNGRIHAFSKGFLEQITMEHRPKGNGRTHGCC
ncbi:hypothetical protein [Candidatus Allofournierella excrementavium]|uniref:hypothetical protein n=1 Tax=Candidatus Allofournierella excrementavium TaxID=2838591 RepID=UPI003AF4265D